MTFACSAERALRVCEDYFRARGGVVTSADSHAVRVRGPLAFLSWDRRLYSRGNIVGINPLALVSTVEAQVQEAQDGACLKLKLVTLRAWFFPALIALVSIDAYQMSAPIFAWGFLAAVLVGNFVVVTWLLQRGLRHELQTYFQKAG